MASRPDPTKPFAAPEGGPPGGARYARAKASKELVPSIPDLYRLLVESVHDYAIFALDRNGFILTWNPGAERFKGWKAEEIVGRHFSAFYLPEDIAAGKPEWELKEATLKGSVEDEGWRLRKDGTRFWADVVITALRDVNGHVVGFAKVTRDLSARREAEAKLRQSEERFRLLVENVRDYAIFSLDPSGYIRSWNHGAERIKGYTVSEIVGRHFSMFYPTEDVAAGKPAKLLRIVAKEGRVEDEGWRVRKDGSLFWASVIITAQRDPTGKLIGFTKVTRDLTERRQAQERAIADARRVAESDAANRAKGEFLTSLSHELRTPLNAIGGYAELILLGIRGPVTDAQRLDLERIKQSQQHLLALVNDLLNFTRTESGRLDYQCEALPLRTAVEAIEAMTRPQALMSDLSLDVDIGEEDGAVAWGDPPKVQQILLNVVSNAIKFTPAGGRVRIGVSRVADRVAVSVSDTGPGIPEEKQEAIFEPFVQLGRSLTSSHEGIGLGLAISRQLARGMGGDLEVESQMGEGSTFTLSLPKAQGT
jgi:PAS domain S-box-containing protein